MVCISFSSLFLSNNLLVQFSVVSPIYWTGTLNVNNSFNVQIWFVSFWAHPFHQIFPTDDRGFGGFGGFGHSVGLPVVVWVTVRDQDMCYTAPFRLREQSAELEQIQILSRVNGNLDLVILDNKSIHLVMFYFQVLHVTYLLFILKLHLLFTSLRNDLFFFLHCIYLLSSL